MTIDRSADTQVVSTEMSARLAQYWWAIALRGVAAVLFGIVALLLPGATIVALTLLFAIYMVSDGILAIVAALRASRQHQRWGWLVLEAIADFIAGGIAFVWPIVTVLAFIYLMGIWAIVSGVLLAAAAFKLHPAHGRWLMVLGSIVSVLWGILLLASPLTGALVLTWWMAGYALFFGASLLALGFHLRNRRPVNNRA
jgi:uncharacterized membrane protein HdeD (DUF308 family)